MTDARRILAGASAALLLSHAAFGWEVTYSVAYGAFALMAAMVSLTFLWLWSRRATPLAGGMVLSWAGAASVVGWWWTYAYMNQPEAMTENAALFLCLALYFVGAVMHFAVIGRSLGLPRYFWGLPVGLATAISSGLAILRHM